jgi:hypothetical protein
MCLVSINKNSTIDKLKIATITFVLLSFMSGFYVQRGFDVFQEIKNGVSFEKGFSFGFFTSNPTTQETRELYKNLQEVVPPHETMLVALDKNFILNFKRNQVYIMDSPGAASFPPGLPMFRGEDELSKYLLSKNIKYLACSCGEKASFSKSFIAGMLKVHVNPWLKTETTNLIDFHDSFQLLAKEKKVLYDDGANIVLDISLNH